MTETETALPHSFAVFMDGPVCGRVKKIHGRPPLVTIDVTRAGLSYAAANYRLSCGYANHGVAVLFFKEVKPR